MFQEGLQVSEFIMSHSPDISLCCTNNLLNLYSKVILIVSEKQSNLNFTHTNLEIWRFKKEKAKFKDINKL